MARMNMSRKDNPQKLTQLSSRSHPKHLVGKRTAQKDTIIDITSDSQVNSNFPYRWSPASLSFNNYFYLFLYLYIMRITINNNAPHLKSPKNQNRRAALGRPAIKITEGLELVCGRLTLALSSALVHRRNNYEQQNKTNKAQAKSKADCWVEGQVATMLETHARQTQQEWNVQWKKTWGDKADVPPWDGQQWNYWGASTSLRSANPALVRQTLSCLVCVEDS